MVDELTPGTDFAGYRIERTLGHGGMGTVYLAWHPRLPRRDALKVLPDNAGAAEEFRARFLREAELAARLDHPNVVAVHDRGARDGRLWIAMEYVPGSDAARLLRAGPPDPDRAVHIVGEAARGLDEAHRHGLLHRDVKPANILVEPQDDAPDRVLIADFGLARAAGDGTALTEIGAVLGTLAYTAPELLTERRADHRADVYSLGCTLFQLLTGTTPFPRESVAAVMHAHLFAPPPRPSELRPGLPAAIDAVIARALAKDPDTRYSSCGALAAATAHAFGGPEEHTAFAPRRTGGTGTVPPPPQSAASAPSYPHTTAVSASAPAADTLPAPPPATSTAPPSSSAPAPAPPHAAVDTPPATQAATAPPSPHTATASRLARHPATATPPPPHAASTFAPSSPAEAGAQPSPRAAVDTTPATHTAATAPPHAPADTPSPSHGTADAPPSLHVAADAPPSRPAAAAALPSPRAAADPTPATHTAATAPPHAPAAASASPHAPADTPAPPHAAATTPLPSHAAVDGPPSSRATAAAPSSPDTASVTAPSPDTASATAPSPQAAASSPSRPQAAAVPLSSHYVAGSAPPSPHAATSPSSSPRVAGAAPPAPHAAAAPSSSPASAPPFPHEAVGTPSSPPAGATARPVPSRASGAPAVPRAASGSPGGPATTELGPAARAAASPVRRGGGWREGLRTPVSRRFVAVAAAVLAVVVGVTAAVVWPRDTATPVAKPPDPVGALTWGRYAFIAEALPGLLPPTPVRTGYQGLRCAALTDDNKEADLQRLPTTVARMRCTGDTNPVRDVVVDCSTNRTPFYLVDEEGVVLLGDQRWQRGSGRGRITWADSTSFTGPVGLIGLQFDEPTRNFCMVVVIGGSSGQDLYDRWWPNAPF
ncbi:protein kinase domain-containing protein [Nocardia thailandica]